MLFNPPSKVWLGTLRHSDALLRHQTGCVFRGRAAIPCNPRAPHVWEQQCPSWQRANKHSSAKSGLFFLFFPVFIYSVSLGRFLLGHVKQIFQLGFVYLPALIYIVLNCNIYDSILESAAVVLWFGFDQNTPDKHTFCLTEGPESCRYLNLTSMRKTRLFLTNQNMGSV